VAGAVTSIEVSRLTLRFNGNPTIGPIPLTVSFTSAATDNSGEAITSWSWNFGDGATSAAQNPSHTYTTTGAFSVSLIATNNFGLAVNGAVGTINRLAPILITANPAAVYSGLVLNGGFETGDFTAWTLS